MGIQEIGKMVRNRATGHIFIPTDKNMKEIGTKTKNMVMASISIKMEMFTREDGGMIIGMEMES